ncbi:hypothetical protein [Dokdonia sp. PRO95]|uniref:hypothetical protein n=1 Tax=Dokdonia sp. PRO95 TaxID=1239415 RepID=UPI000AE086E5|nr:hypothetical protein [Dokdonia sp. PRO95]
MSLSKQSLCVIGMIFYSFVLISQVGVGTRNPSEKAMLEVTSQIDGAGAYLGFMPPRVPSDAARDGIPTTIADKGMMVYVEATGCIDIFNGEFWGHIKCASEIPVRTDIWINEIHYENAGPDTGEFIEIAGAAGLDINGYSIVLYNGNNNSAYNTQFLTGLIPNDTGNGFGFVTISYPPNGIQNGGALPDGLALVNPAGKIIQFLSYEGVFTAVGGVADGITSINIGVEENTATPIGQSLQLRGGPGNVYANFNWITSAISTSGAANNDQSFD